MNLKLSEGCLRVRISHHELQQFKQGHTLKFHITEGLPKVYVSKNDQNKVWYENHQIMIQIAQALFAQALDQDVEHTFESGLKLQLEVDRHTRPKIREAFNGLA